MNVAEAKDTLRDLFESRRTGLQAQLTTRGESPRDFAVLRLSSTAATDEFAEVSTRGDGWFELEVDGGFYTGTTSDVTSDEEVREILDRYVQAAIEYVSGRRSLLVSKLGRTRFVSIDTSEGRLKLRASRSQHRSG